MRETNNIEWFNQEGGFG